MIKILSIYLVMVTMSSVRMVRRAIRARQICCRVVAECVEILVFAALAFVDVAFRKRAMAIMDIMHGCVHEYHGCY